MRQYDAQYRQIAVLLRWLLLLYLTFVVYGSLVPFHFTYRPFGEALATFRHIPFHDLGIGSRADWVANLLLFIPLSFLAGLVFESGINVSRRIVTSGAILVSAAFLAIGIEFAQLYFPGRTVGLNDIYAECTGAVVGLILKRVYGLVVLAWISGFWEGEIRQDKVGRLLYGYLAVFFAFNVLPLDLTISPVELYHKWTENRIILLPFGGFKGSLAQATYKFATDIIVWIPVGLLWSMRYRLALRQIMLWGFGLGLAVEMLQLFVYSRVSNVTDVLLAGLGTGIGHGVFLAAGRHRASLARVPPWTFKVLWLTWLLAILVAFWFPFNFDATRLAAPSTQAAFGRMPFLGLYMMSEFNAINELLRKMGLFFPGGLMVGLFVHSSTTHNRLGRLASWWLLFLIPALVEFGQLMLPDRIGDLTDAILETAGGVVGYMVSLWVMGAPTGAGAVSARVLPSFAMPRFPDGWRGHVLAVTVLAAILGVIGTWSGARGEILRLFTAGTPVPVTALSLAAASYWFAVGMFWILPEGRRSKSFFFAFPLALLVHALVAWCLVRLFLPGDAVGEVLGVPTQQLPWELEMLLRYVALHVSVALQLLGALLVVAALLHPLMMASFFYWLLISMMLAWPLYAVVSGYAAVQNLIALIRGGGSFLACSALVGAVFLTFFAASALSLAMATGHRRRVLVGAALLASVGAGWLYWLGLEPTVIRNGRVFSAFQLLLSSDRKQYATDAALLVRYLLAYGGFVVALALLQAPRWRERPTLHALHSVPQATLP